MLLVGITGVPKDGVDDVGGWPFTCCVGGIGRLAGRGVIFIDSSATASRSASCFKRFPDVGISVGRERYGEMSAVLDVRREDEPREPPGCTGDSAADELDEDDGCCDVEAALVPFAREGWLKGNTEGVESFSPNGLGLGFVIRFGYAGAEDDQSARSGGRVGELVAGTGVLDV
jgi:hypothetical protein